MINDNRESEHVIIEHDELVEYANSEYIKLIHEDILLCMLRNKSNTYITDIKINKVDDANTYLIDVLYIDKTTENVCVRCDEIDNFLNYVILVNL